MTITKTKQLIAIALVVLGVFTYFLGAGIAHYLGNPIDSQVLGIGLFWILGIITFIYFSIPYFEEIRSGSAGFDKQTDESSENPLFRKEIKLLIAFIGLTISAIMMVMMLWIKMLTFPVAIIMIGVLLTGLLFSVPPIQAWKSTFAEFVSSIFVANLIPLFAFILFAGEYHRLLAMITFPLTVLLIAVQLIASLPDYALFTKTEFPNMIVRLGWRSSISLHNVFILITYVLFGVGLLFGLPISIGLPPIFTLPLSLFQIWYLSRLMDGAKPDFRILLFNSAAITGLTFYLLVFAVWTN